MKLNFTLDEMIQFTLLISRVKLKLTRIIPVNVLKCYNLQIIGKDNLMIWFAFFMDIDL